MSRRRSQLLVLAVLGLMLSAAACLPLLGQGLLWMIRPAASFDALPVPDAPDYTRPQAWAARPDLVDGADRLPPGAGLVDGQASAGVDCFIVHPTTYAGTESWNQPIDDPTARRLLDELVLPVQAAVFNDACRVFAPHYRQATLYAFRDRDDNATKALDLAYSDVERAFDTFVQQLNRDRPYVLAGHSQGTLLLLRLLRQRISGTGLQARLVVAYLPGWTVAAQDLLQLPDIPVCREAAQTGCLVSWNTEQADARPAFVDLTSPDTVCVNPLSWTRDGQYLGHAFNHGGLALDREQPLQLPHLEPGISDAQCVRGALRVSPVDDARFRNDLVADALLGPGVLHNVDYGLFYLDLRTNLGQRVAAFMTRGR
ncbi:MAG: DUF3089 domain-containing protein [Pseudomonadota bacterium]